MRAYIPDNVSGKILEACCSRRGFIGKSLFAGIASTMMARGLRTAFADDRPIPPGARLAGHGKAKRAIFIYLAGGPSHLDTFDPKPGRPTAGPFTPIKTKIPGVLLGEHLPKLADRMLDVALIRSMTSNEGNHTRARTLVHTGYPPEATVVHPTFGSSLSKELGKDDFELPNFVSIGPSADGAAFHGPAHAPLVMARATRPPENLEYHAAAGKDRVERRLGLLEKMQADFGKSHGVAVTEGHDEMFAKAKRMIDTPLRATFDVQQEKESVRKAYGVNNVGQGALLARRLVENGVTCAEVTMGGWDTHNEAWDALPPLVTQLDQALSALLDDLKDRGMLDSTLVACFGEFGRTPKINTQRNGRDHWAKSWSALVAGGGVMGGQVIGETDIDGMAPKSRPVQVPDLHASLWHAFGVDPWTEYEANERPITLTPKEGSIVKELFV